MVDKSKNIDIYYTIGKTERAEIKVKGSKFIATASHAPDKESAMGFLQHIESEFYNATHNCFAYKIGYDGMEYRAVDNGEPSGTAGKPILFTINKFDLSDIIVVVTRYFGGTKLGVGGLARAYADSASAVLEICEKKPVHRTSAVKVFCTYQDISAVKKIIDETAVTFEENYHDAIEILANVPISKVDYMIKAIISATKGRAGAVLVS